MTRNEHRAQCFAAMDNALYEKTGTRMSHRTLAFIFDALHGLARVDPVEATDEMEAAGWGYNWDDLCPSVVWLAMSEAGDLTNGPEEEP